jgi:hypothetical protein
LVCVFFQESPTQEIGIELYLILPASWHISAPSHVRFWG